MTAATDNPTTDPIGTGVGGWLSYVGHTLGAIPGQYREATRQHRGRTIGLTILAVAAVTLGAINVFGGFAVTERMLQMFKRREPGK